MSVRARDPETRVWGNTQALNMNLSSTARNGPNRKDRNPCSPNTAPGARRPQTRAGDPDAPARLHASRMGTAHNDETA